MKSKLKTKKGIIIYVSISAVLISLFIFTTSPEYHCMQVSEETKKDYLQYLYDGLSALDKSRIDTGLARIIDSDTLPIDKIKDKAYEFCISQKPNVPATVVLQFETSNSTHTVTGNNTTIFEPES